MTVSDATPFVVASAKRKLRLFDHFPTWGLEDLVQEGLVRVQSELPKFDPARSSFSTWVFRIVSARLIDLYRAESRRAAWAAVNAIESQADIDRARPHAHEHDDPELDLASWLHGVYQAAKNAMPAFRERRGRKWYSLPQAFAIAALMRRNRLSCRGAAMVIAKDARLMQILRLRRRPSRMFCHRAQELVNANVEGLGESFGKSHFAVELLPSQKAGDLGLRDTAGASQGAAGQSSI